MLKLKSLHISSPTFSDISKKICKMWYTAKKSSFIRSIISPVYKMKMFRSWTSETFWNEVLFLRFENGRLDLMFNVQLRWDLTYIIRLALCFWLGRGRMKRNCICCFTYGAHFAFNMLICIWLFKNSLLTSSTILWFSDLTKNIYKIKWIKTCQWILNWSIQNSLIQWTNVNEWINLFFIIWLILH